MDTANCDASIQTRKVLFVTNSESGQANTILAMALEAAARPHVEAHIASFPDLKRRVEGLSPKINFHLLDGKGMIEMMIERTTAQGILEETLVHPPTTKSYEPYGRIMGLVLTGWDGECAFYFLLWMRAITDVRAAFLV